MSFIPFDEVKAANPIESVVARLGIELKKSGSSHRGRCPACEGSGERSLVVTPEKSAWYCFSAQRGGDVIALVQHINGGSAKEAAAWLGGATTERPKEKAKQPEAESGRGFAPLSYLDPDHPAVEAVGFDPADAKRIGCGYAPRGILRGYVAIPVRDETGRLLGYAGVQEAKLPGEWKW